MPCRPSVDSVDPILRQSLGLCEGARDDRNQCPIICPKPKEYRLSLSCHEIQIETTTMQSDLVGSMPFWRHIYANNTLNRAPRPKESRQPRKVHSVRTVNDTMKLAHVLGGGGRVWTNGERSVIMLTNVIGKRRNRRTPHQRIGIRSSSQPTPRGSNQ